MSSNLQLLFLPISKTTPLPLQRATFLSTLYINCPQSILVYRDGSLWRQLPFDSVCVALTVPSFSVSQQFKLRDLLSIFEAEAFAILKYISLEYIQAILTLLFWFVQPSCGSFFSMGCLTLWNCWQWTGRQVRTTGSWFTFCSPDTSSSHWSQKWGF